MRSSHGFPLTAARPVAGVAGKLVVSQDALYRRSEHTETEEKICTISEGGSQQREGIHEVTDHVRSVIWGKRVLATTRRANR